MSGVNLKVLRFAVVEWVEPVLNFPPITHPVVIRIGIVHVRPVLGLFEFVRKTITVGIECFGHQFRISTNIFLNGTIESTDVFAGLKEPRYTHKKGAKNQGRNDCYIRHLIVVKTHW